MQLPVSGFPTPLSKFDELTNMTQLVEAMITLTGFQPINWAAWSNKFHVPDIDMSVASGITLPDQFATFDQIYQDTWARIQEFFSTLPAPIMKPAFDLDPVSDVPVIGDPPDPGDITIPDFTTPAPTMDIPPSPEWVEETPPPKPIITAPPQPPRPDLVWPPVPEFSPIAVPDTVALAIPTFDETFTDEDLLLPTYRFNFTERDYESALKDAINSGLLTEIQTGGYGLNPNDEALLFQRAREREDSAAQKAIEEVKRNFSMSGFPIPVGAMTKQMEKAAYEAVAKNSSINRELTLKRADLYWDGKKFAFTSGLQLEQLTMNLHNAAMERALNAAKAEMEILIAYFNAQVARYQARLAKFKTLSEVYEIRVRAEIAKVEIFKAQIEAAKMQGELQKNQVDLYKAQVEGVTALIQAYKSDVEVMDVLMNVEKTRMEVFRAEVEAYSSMVMSQKVKFDAYDSKIKGEVAKMQGFESEAKAYAAGIEGKKATVDVRRLQLQSYTERLNAILAKYKLQVEQKKDIRDVQKDVLAADVTVYKADIEAFSTKVDAAVKSGGLQIQGLEAAIRSALTILAHNTEVAKLELQRAIELCKILSQLEIGTMEANSRLFTAVISTRNLNLSAAAHLGRSQSEARSESGAQSQHLQYSETLEAATIKHINVEG
jgi:hypothetical protein